MGSITCVKGIKVGHACDFEGVTGITIVLCEDGAIASAEVVGGAPGTRETDLLNPSCSVSKIHGLFLAGGSAFGLNAAEGIVRYLEEKNIGLDTQVTKVPIVSGAIIFDLGIGSPKSRPTDDMAYSACRGANSSEVSSGNIGVGLGATVGKLYGPKHMMKSGLGTASLELPGGISVGCIIVVNAVGDVFHPNTGCLLAGAYDRENRKFLNCPSTPITKDILSQDLWGKCRHTPGENTTIGVVATDANLSKEECKRIAIMSMAGIAQTIRPVFTPLDGDTMFVISTGKTNTSVINSRSQSRTSFLTQIGVAAQRVVAKSVLNAVAYSEAKCGIPAMRDLMS